MSCRRTAKNIGGSGRSKKRSYEMNGRRIGFLKAMVKPERCIGRGNQNKQLRCICWGPKEETVFESRDPQEPPRSRDGATRTALEMMAA